MNLVDTNKVLQFQKLLADSNILTADVPKNVTHLLSPLDLTVNKSIKLLERKEFTNYFTENVARALQQNLRWMWQTYNWTLKRR